MPPGHRAFGDLQVESESLIMDPMSHLRSFHHLSVRLMWLSFVTGYHMPGSLLRALRALSHLILWRILCDGYDYLRLQM